MLKSTSTYLVLSLFTFTAPALQAQYNSDNLKLSEEIAVSKYSHDKLRIYPITANRVFFEAHKSLGNYKPLKEGLEDGTVMVKEQGAVAAAPTNHPDEQTAEPLNNAEPVLLSNSNRPNRQSRRNDEPLQVQGEREVNISGGGGSDAVNKLFIENSSADTVFIMAGEVVKGGKQDRVIAQDMVIPPNSGLVDLSVFCVEKGRWTYAGSSSADGFTGYANVSTTSVRKAAITTQDQSTVWQEVDKVTIANDASSTTHTLNALEKNEEYQKELKEYEARFSDLPQVSPSVIGVVAVTGDRVIGCDMFATPDLFKNAYPDLLKSYISEAISSGASVSITNEEVDKYITRILEDEAKQAERVKQNGQMYERNGVKMHISTF